MSRYMNPTYASLKPYIPGEIPRDRSFVKLNTNESPYPPSPGVCALYTEDNAKLLRLYSDPASIDLDGAIAGAMKVRRENVMATGGSDEALELAFMAYGADGITCPDETYGFYGVLCGLHGIKMNTIPLKEDLSVDPADYDDAGTMAVIANPNAPTGLYLKPEQVERILQHNPDHVVLIDEAYVDFGNESVIPLIRQYDNLLVVQTFSKSRSLAGARIGFACGSAALIEDLERLRNSRNPYDLTRQSQLAGVKAIEEAVYYRDNCAKIIRTREWTMRKLKALGFECTDSCTNFVFVRHPKISGKDVNLGLREKGFLVRWFDRPRIKDYNRITIGTQEQMEALVKAMEDLTHETECGTETENS